jgi:hypothetical protein
MIVFPFSFNKPSASSFSMEIFTSVGTTSWVAPANVTLVEYLVVGGGGGGGNGYDNAGGGGGGGGMVLTGTLSVTPGTSYTVTVGDGGAGGANARANNAGSPGQNSVFATITSFGGGNGFGSRTGGVAGVAQIADTNAPSGGAGSGGGQGGKGGGGASGNGSNNSGTVGGAGGVGSTLDLTGSSVTYGVGGAGANAGTQNPGVDGTSNTGNGGRAGGATSSNSTGGGKGGSGIVVIVNRSMKGTLSNPGISAQDILDSGQTESGWYYIQTSTMAEPKQVYCNMTDESGGWMLIGYTPSFNNTNGGLGAGLSYPNTWQNGEGTFNRLRVSTMDLWFHNGSAQCTQVMKMATTSYNQIPLLDNCQIANKVIYSNPSNLLLSTVSNYPAFVNNTAMAGTWYPIKGHTLMSTSLTVDAPGDWIYSVNNSWWTVCGPSTQLTSNGRSGNAQGTGSWTNPSTNNLYGMSNVAATTNSNRTDIQTYAVYIK